MIGFLLPKQKLEKMVKGSETTENLKFYLQLAEQHQVDIVLYSLNRLDKVNLKVNGFCYSVKNKTLLEKTIDLPKINLFRIVLNRYSTYLSFKKIEEEHNIRFLNLVPPRDKYTIYQHLKENANLSKHIPHTKKLKYKSLKQFLNKYHRVIIKPNNGSLGEKVYLIQKHHNKLVVNYTSKKNKYVKILTHNQLYSFYHKNLMKHNFILQPWITFKKIAGNKFDIRTSIQKNSANKWEMTGIVGRVATKKGIVTNIAQGGYAISYTDLKQLLEEEAKAKIEQFSINIAIDLEKLYPAIVDLGLDIGIDIQDNLWFIEANFCDQRYAYNELGDNEMWFRSYKYPFEYTISQ